MWFGFQIQWILFQIGFNRSKIRIWICRKGCEIRFKIYNPFLHLRKGTDPLFLVLAWNCTQWVVKVRINSHYFEFFRVLFYLRKSVQGLLYPLVLVERFRKRTCRPLRWLDWIFLGGYLPSLSINYVTMSKDMENRFPQLFYIKMKISYDLGFIAIGVAMAT